MDGLTAVVLRRVAAALAGVRVPKDTRVTVVATKEAEPRVAVCTTPKEVRQAVQGFGGVAKVHVVTDLLAPATKAAQEWQVQQVEVTLARKRGRRLETKKVPIDTARYDALFWSAAAVEKFLAPHYAAVYGAAQAASLVTAYDTSTSDTVIHDCYSHYTTVTDPTTLTVSPSDTTLPPA